MKTLWMILIGMALFNGFLLSFNVFFAPSSPQSSGLYDITDVAHNESYEAYKHPGVLSFNVISIGLTSLSITGIGLIIAVLTRDLKYLGAGAIAAFVSSLWTSSGSIFGGMMNSFPNNPVLPMIYTIISIAIGLCVALLVLGIFTGQEQLQ